MSGSLELPETRGAACAGAADADIDRSSPPDSSAGDGARADVANVEWLAAKKLARERLAGATTEDVLARIEAAWPEWVAAGCPPPADTSNPPARTASGMARGYNRPQLRAPIRQPLRAPFPVEAVAALRVLTNCRMLGYGHLPKNRLVRGLVRALRLTDGASAATASGSDSAGGSGNAPGQLGPAAVSRALCSLSRLGGSIFYVAEAEALCSMIPRQPMSKLQHVRR